ncbi:uncharacterized protein LOC131357746 [Hemibagrus wyckioides]|uniref:uncharacterized protein LOC131357746 n=1 Tax=Hemibagrus wyckioides TaxID=337641 RepID=UPI00266BD8A8|nr:uncharacterized protein LOC131357746 [Hemibagrus wyckioides]
MTDLWILILIFSTIYSVQPGRRWVTAQSTDPSVYQPDKELSVNIRDSAILRCCIIDKEVGLMVWFKQTYRKKPQIIVSVFKSGGAVFHTGFQKSRYWIERSSNCCKMIILSVIQSDEAMYYCAVTRPNLVFADGTYLKIKGENFTIESETSKPAVSDNSVVCEPTTANDTNMNTQDKTVSEMNRSLHWTVFGLGTALGLCALLIFCLTYYILRRIINDNCRLNASTENCVEMRQESETETLNYAALQFSKKKAKAGRKDTSLDTLCVYSDVNKAIKYNVNAS